MHVYMFLYVHMYRYAHIQVEARGQHLVPPSTVLISFWKAGSLTKHEAQQCFKASWPTSPTLTLRVLLAYNWLFMWVQRIPTQVP